MRCFLLNRRKVHTPRANTASRMSSRSWLGSIPFLNNYIWGYWFVIIGPAAVTCYKQDIRTNNYVESYHASLLKLIKPHPKIWEFLSMILKNWYFPSVCPFCVCHSIFYVQVVYTYFLFFNDKRITWVVGYNTYVK